MIHQLAARHRLPDRVLGQGPAVGGDDARSRPDAPVRERDVRGDDDVVLPCSLGDPIVRRVEPLRDADELDPPRSAGPERGVRDHVDLEVVAEGDLVRLLLHRAGVAVHEEVQHTRPRLPPDAGAPEARDALDRSSKVGAEREPGERHP